jgi:putative ABC transport system permease protein
MRALRAWLLRLGASLSGRARRSDVVDELNSHLAFHIEDNVRAGMTPAEARRVALLKLGGFSQTAESIRERRGLPFVDSLRQDLVYAVRVLRRNRGFTATAVLTFALGIGANSAIFSIVNAILLRPLPLADPSRLVMIFATEARRSLQFDGVSYPAFVDWREQNRSFESLAAITNQTLPFGLSDEVIIARGKVVTANLFDVVGVQPAIGRAFRDWRLGSPDVVILSDGFWRRHFGGSLSAVGQTVRIDERPHTIVGVMPPGFAINGDSEEFFQPLGVDTNRGRGFLRIIGRLRPGVTLGQARDDLSAIARRLERIYPGTHEGVGANLVPMGEAVTRRVRTGLLTIMAVVGVVLMIACANVASLMLARGATRQQELALRAALGAGRLRLARQLLTESAVIAAAGGALGLLVAHWMGSALAAAVADQFRVPGIGAVRIDRTVLLFTVGVSATAGLGFGIAPAFASLSRDPSERMREASRSTTGRRAPRARSGLVIAETALALVLLVGGGTLIKTFLTLQATPPGFNPARLIKADLSLPLPSFLQLDTRVGFGQAALARVRALPGVRAAALVANLPLNNGSNTESFHIVGKPDPSPARGFNAVFNMASAGYFRMMGIPILEGRELDEHDAAGASDVAVINEAAARAFWPGESPLGHQIVLPINREISQTLTVVGVVGDVRQASLGVAPRPEFVLSPMQSRLALSAITIVAQTEREPKALGESLRAAVHSVNPLVPISRIVTVDDVVSSSIVEPRLYATLLGAFALLALVLACVGLYGLIAYSVSQRRHEFGVRVALGAAQSTIVRLVVGEGLHLAVAGVGIGLVVAAAATRLLVGLVVGVEPQDPVTFAVVTLVLVAATLLATYIPARRAARVDPIAALRDE